jgi:C2H2-type zinc finger
MFGNASALAKHRLTHSDERKYLCTVCHKAFKRQDHLNGHLLTHRNKKPFECTTEGCNKSYCDARSLRRHRENHHSNREDKMVSPASSVTSNGDFDEKSLGSDSFDSPNKMAAAAQKMVESKPVLPMADIPTFNILENYMNSDKESAVGKLAAAGVVLPHALAAPREQQQPQPSAEMMAVAASMVECTICARRFKNIPALNGHMRLHGGYYRKDMDKKSETRPAVVTSNSSSSSFDRPAAPTHTVSNSVRTLIEEKIIQKRKLEPLQSKGQSITGAILQSVLPIVKQNNSVNNIGPSSGTFFCRSYRILMNF